MGIKDLLSGGVVGAMKEAFIARQARKENEASLEAAIVQQRESGKQTLELQPGQWEALQAWKNESTWKDEYVTVSVVAIFNIIVLGAIAAAFGFPQVLEGIKLAVQTLNEVMTVVNPTTGESEWTPMGTLISVTIFCAIGVYSWKKLF